MEGLPEALKITDLKMGRQVFILLIQAVLTVTVSGQLCIDRNIQTVGRVVFGEARGESMKGQLAVAYTIVNRINHEGYPNNLSAVVNQKTESGGFQYETLDLASHTQAWNNAERTNTLEYRNAIQASGDVLCRRKVDPTGCATDYCAFDPCHATDSNQWWTATSKMQIGNHFFVCRVPATG
ncbi:spore cortex-lytic enzyme-like [Ostrea edulis]|uniref:spore cortex-lytic enzyme-like n=1 Tax=Ostrea edulis TaxID=37623 RepID=UPI0020953301|nr:spore cortex-lytic enzyme-like [Ostrea edulis]